MLLYNVTSKRLSGPFTAASTCAHWDPDAWGGAYPRQVKIVHWPPNEAGVTVPRGTRGLHAGPLNGASISRLHQVIYGAAPLFTAEEVGVKRGRSEAGQEQEPEQRWQRCGVCEVSVLQRERSDDDGRRVRRRVVNSTTATRAVAVS